MKYRPWALLSLLVLSCNPGFARSPAEIRSLVAAISDIPYICRQSSHDWDKSKSGCGDSAFWSLVITRDTLIDDLIDLIDDTTLTQAEVPNFGGNYAIGDAALTVLQEILWDIHPLKLVGLQLSSTCGNCAYWEYVRGSKRNRQNLEMKLRRWYSKKRKWMVWVPGNEFGTCDCRGNHPGGGHFRIARGR